MFKTVAAVSAVAVVGGAALNMVNSARAKPATGIAAGAVAFGGGALLAFLLGMFKGTRQYVTPVLAGAAAVGGLAALSGPINRGSASIANALLGRTATGGTQAALPGGGAQTQSFSGGQRMQTQGQGFTGMVPDRTTSAVLPPSQPRAASAPRESKGQSLIKLGSSLADAAASIASTIGGGRGGVAAAAGLDDDLDGSEGMDDFNIGSGDDLDGSEGMDDFAIAGAAMLDD
jgi:hypothetical protein